jgi:hypothetical protein
VGPATTRRSRGVGPATTRRSESPGRLIARVLAAALILAVLAAPSAATPALDYLFVVTSDYEVSGQASTVGVLPPWTVDEGLASVHSDAVAREHGGLIYVVNRLYQDNVQVLDPAQGFATVRQFSVGPGSNPQDIVFTSPTRAYVSRYEETTLLEVDPTTGGVTDTIDLSEFADADGIPEMGQMAIWRDFLFVTIQRLDRDYFWLPVPPSYLAVIDTDTNELVDTDPGEPGIQGIVLAKTNPSTEILEGPDGTLYLGEAGSWGTLDGGVEAIDPATLGSLGLVTTEAQLGGEVNDVTLPVDGRAHAIVSVSSPSWEAFAIAFDWETGEKIEDVWRPGGFDVTDVEVHPGAGELFVADRTYEDPGVRVFDASDGSQLTPGPLDVGLPPHDLLVVGDAIVGVPEGADPHAPTLGLAVSPNPCRGCASVAFALPAPGEAEVGVYDVAGRLVSGLHSGAVASGESRLRWEGTEAAGRPVASGVYFVRLSYRGSTAIAKLLLIR